MEYLNQVSSVLQKFVSEVFLPLCCISRDMRIRIAMSIQLLGVQSVHAIYIQSRQPGTFSQFKSDIDRMEEKTGIRMRKHYFMRFPLIVRKKLNIVRVVGLKDGHYEKQKTLHCFHFSCLHI